MGSRERREREKAELKQKREQEIIEAAEQLFLEKGFHKTTVNDIARACELTGGALYLYFKNKEELILVIMTRVSRQLADSLVEHSRSASTGYESLKTCLEFYRESFTSYHSYHVLDARFNSLFDSAYPDTPLLDEYFTANRRVFSAIRSVFETGLSDGTLRLPLAGENALERTVHMFLNVTNSYMEKLSLRRTLMEQEQGISLENELSDYMDFLLRSCRPV